MLAVAALSLPFAAALASPSPEERDTEVLITRVGPDPGVPSGIIAFAVEFSGVAGGREETYFIPFLSIGQPKPNVGQRCDIDWHWWRDGFQWVLGDGRQISSGRLVSRFHCR